MAVKDTTLLEAALIGFQHRRDEILQAISDIEARLGGKRRDARSARPDGGTVVRKRRPMSAAARKRIADAQKKRWAAYHKQRGAKTAA